ncbi:hypothetical protein J4526_09600 [Desulfurococcaceae archaeon MEX13E-LK6-19]|nr:hypothetical protein J4526_09600 [Desulfurococcaceae archaeon MEX13E-LK6-19]
MEEPKPIYAQGFFVIHKHGLFNQIIIFDYYDPDNYYYKLLRRKNALAEEKEVLKNNMQYFLDQEKVLINGNESRPIVKDVEIGVRGRPDLAYIIFNIEFYGELTEGVNVYENIYEEEEVEYDYIVQWIIHEKGRFIDAELGVAYELRNNSRLLLFKVPRGTKVGGYEKIVFELF